MAITTSRLGREIGAHTASAAHHCPNAHASGRADAIPFVPGVAEGPISRDPRAAGAILVLDAPSLPDGARPAGIVVAQAAPFSHPMLALLARGIPTVIVDVQHAATLRDGDRVRIDGTRGRVQSAISDVASVGADSPVPEAGQTVRTADGTPVALRASVRDAEGARRALERGAESIGLVRTEFIAPPDGRQPDTAFYGQAFAALFDAASALAITLRLVDIAADKRPAWLPPSVDVGGALGCQGVRLFDEAPVRSVVDAQLAALSGLGARDRIRLLLPYVTHVAEADRWRRHARAALDVPVGAMVETPAAALDIRALLAAADFAALGTNDLMQCLFAADRDHHALRGYLDPYAPVLYRFLTRVARDAGAHLNRVQVCGLLAQLPGTLPLLIGLGFRAFSVDTAYIPVLAGRAQETIVRDAEVLAEAVCRAANSAAVREMLGTVWFND